MSLQFTSTRYSDERQKGKPYVQPVDYDVQTLFSRRVAHVFGSRVISGVEVPGDWDVATDRSPDSSIVLRVPASGMLPTKRSGDFIERADLLTPSGERIDLVIARDRMALESSFPSTLFRSLHSPTSYILTPDRNPVQSASVELFEQTGGRSFFHILRDISAGRAIPNSDELSPIYKRMFEIFLQSSRLGARSDFELDGYLLGKFIDDDNFEMVASTVRERVEAFREYRAAMGWFKYLTKYSRKKLDSEWATQPIYALRKLKESGLLEVLFFLSYALEKDFQQTDANSGIEQSDYDSELEHLFFTPNVMAGSTSKYRLQEPMIPGDIELIDNTGSLATIIARYDSQFREYLRYTSHFLPGMPESRRELNLHEKRNLLEILCNPYRFVGMPSSDFNATRNGAIRIVASYLLSRINQSIGSEISALIRHTTYSPSYLIPMWSQESQESQATRSWMIENPNMTQTDYGLKTESIAEQNGVETNSLLQKSIEEFVKGPRVSQRVRQVWTSIERLDGEVLKNAVANVRDLSWLSMLITVAEHEIYKQERDPFNDAELTRVHREKLRSFSNDPDLIHREIEQLLTEDQRMIDSGTDEVKRGLIGTSAASVELITAKTVAEAVTRAMTDYSIAETSAIDIDSGLASYYEEMAMAKGVDSDLSSFYLRYADMIRSRHRDYTGDLPDVNRTVTLSLEKFLHSVALVNDAIINGTPFLVFYESKNGISKDYLIPTQLRADSMEGITMQVFLCEDPELLGMAWMSQEERLEYIEANYTSRNPAVPFYNEIRESLANYVFDSWHVFPSDLE